MATIRRITLIAAYMIMQCYMIYFVCSPAIATYGWLKFLGTLAANFIIGWIIAYLFYSDFWTVTKPQATYKD